MPRVVLLVGRERVVVCGLAAEVVGLAVADQKLLNALGTEARGNWSAHFAPEGIAAHLVQHTQRIRRAGRLRLADDENPGVSSAASA